MEKENIERIRGRTEVWNVNVRMEGQIRSEEDG